MMGGTRTMPDERITRTVLLLPPVLGGAEVADAARRRDVSSFIYSSHDLYYYTSLF
jgi:hypothetical protein